MDRNIHVSRKRGFTLIELLAVVVIIAILGAITVMTGKYVMQRMNFKKAHTDLINIQHAIEAFYVAYGHYPPTGHFGHQPIDINPDSTNDLSDGDQYYIPPSDRLKVYTPAGAGLEGYIFSEVKTHKSAGISDDGFLFPSEARKWAHFVEDIQLGDFTAGWQTNRTPDKGESRFLPVGIVVVDPWMSLTTLSPGGAELRYQYSSSAADNYQTYELWCKGADLNNTNDDFYIHRLGDSTQQAHTYEVR